MFAKSFHPGQVHFRHIACFSLVFLLILGSFSGLVFGDSYTLSSLLGSSVSNVTLVDDYTFSVSDKNVSIQVGGSSPYLFSGSSTASVSFTLNSFSLSNYSGGALTFYTNGTPTSLVADGSPLSSTSNSVRYSGSDIGVMHTVTLETGAATYFGFSSNRTSGSTASTAASYSLTINDITIDGVSVFGNLTPPLSLSYTFDNGYLMVIDLGSSGVSYDFDLYSKSESLSSWPGGTFPDTNQSYWFASTLPGVDDSIPDSSASLISWSRGDNRNIFGQSYDMVATLSGSSSARYLCVYNPPVHTKWSSGSNPTSSEVVNYPVTLHGLSDQAFWIFNSSASLAITGTSEAIIDATIIDDTGIGIISGGAISVVDSNGDLYSQTAGGATDISGANGGSIQANIRGLQQTLDDFVTQFTSLLSAPIAHIQQLISVGGNFMHAIGEMFSWIPAPVQGVLTSGLVVMVVIGVLKLLL